MSILSSEIESPHNPVALAKTVKYRGAGTVEYLYDENRKLLFH